MFNKIILVGNLTRDIEMKYTQSGTVIANTAIATTRKYTTNGEKKEDVCFVDITFFSRSAEVANQYLRKGSKILVEGRLNFEQWTDNNGQKRSKHTVVVETMQMLDSKSSKGETNQHQQTQHQQVYQQPQSNNTQTNQSYSHHQQNDRQQYKAPHGNVPVHQENIDEDGIPF